MSGFDLDGYAARIRLGGSIKADAECLTNMTAGQARHIVFENLDPYLGRPVMLDDHSLCQKLIYRHRGGYCFELNGLLQLALISAGFEVTPFLGRVCDEEGNPGRRTHIVLTVNAGGRRFLADCGFGRAGPHYAMPIETGRIDVQNGEAYRITEDPRWGMVLQIRDGDWRSLYSFGDSTFLPVDAEMANFYTNMWPMQRFRSDLVAARITAHGRLTLQNLRFREYRQGQMSELAINTPQELARILQQSFEIPESEIDMPAICTRLGLNG